MPQYIYHYFTIIRNNKTILLIYGYIVYNVGMYLRKFNQPPENIIKNGKALFGAYEGIPERIDIRGMRAPYAGVPVPSFLSNLRIKSRLNYVFSIEKYFGMAEFFDFKIIGLGKLIFWNKETGKRTVYNTIMPTRKRFVPNFTKRGICACYKKSRFLKISWGRNHQHHALSFNVKGDKVRPDATGYCYSPLKDDMHRDLLYVNPAPTSARCSATWITTMKIAGSLSANNEKIDDSEGLAFMVMNRTYFKMHSKTTMLCGMGNVKDRNIIFYLKTSNMDAADSDKYNDNTLVIDGEPTALPPVYITHPFGIDKKWIIQDTENMVDLSFTPSSVYSNVLNLIALRTSSNTLSGTLEGALLTKDGEKIILKNFYGIIHRNLLRL